MKYVCLGFFDEAKFAQLPPEAGLKPVLAPLMSVMLISLALTVAVNVLGVATALAYAAVRRLR